MNMFICNYVNSCAICQQYKINHHPVKPPLQPIKGPVSDHPFVRPVEPDEKDNLTEIKGIGPFIEKRLNMLGIYTFKQLSELTPELIDRVGNAIEFFPGRIERENWIGQARGFLKA